LDMVYAMRFFTKPNKGFQISLRRHAQMILPFLNSTIGRPPHALLSGVRVYRTAMPLGAGASNIVGVVDMRLDVI
jgi:hypothetical protein